MSSDLLTIILGFLEGFLLILSPCILPILPIVLAGSLAGSKKRPLGIVTGFTLTFSMAAFFSRQLLQYANVDLNFIRHLSYLILLLLGFIMLSSSLTEKFSQITSRLANLGNPLTGSSRREGGFFSGLWLGGLIAIIWTPCAGPILAAVIVQIAIQKTSLTGFFTLTAFALGAAIPMLIITLYGKMITDNFSFFKTNASLFRKLLGAIIMASVIYMIYQEKSARLSALPQTSVRTATYLEGGLWHPYEAPKIDGIETWINSPALQVSDLKGKVVLVDFWTYSCINCIRTLPYLKAWYQRYQDKGLVIIGVHSPEFDFEKNVDNVKNAVHRDGILYPVALDNQFVTWRNFNNHYWPAQYLINKQGNVVYQHFGEGDDEVTENNIRFLLDIDKVVIPTPVAKEQASYFQTPETYLGYARSNFNLSPVVTQDKVANYSFPSKLASNTWALQGAWQVNADKIVTANADASIEIHFNAKHVYAVMGSSATNPIKVNLLLNGKLIKSINVGKPTLYEVATLKKFGDGILQIIATEPGLYVFTFTFGA